MNVGDRDFDFVRRQLKTALPPWPDTELKQDLWPRMLTRLEDVPARWSWFEALLAGLAALSFAVFPELIPAMLYHL